MRSFTLILVILLCGALGATAQRVPSTGTRFTFAVPEGPDQRVSTGELSELFLTVLSDYDGEGVLWSPSGMMLPFSFRTGVGTEVRLPYSIMLLSDLGLSQRGIIVRTTQPVNLTLHLNHSGAGEATQIWPDEALDTNHLLPGWGIFNDPGESNRTQLTIVAPENNTTVTVIPTVDCMGGERQGVPSVMVLNQGECYVIKADTTGEPRQSSLFRTRVTSNKPVSVFTSSTCAYVPLQVQSCNPLLDHILPLKYAGNEFFVSTPSDIGHSCRVLFISESDNFLVYTSGSTVIASNGRAELLLTQPSLFRTSVPVQCYLLSNGIDLALVGDPSIVTVLPADRYYQDTLRWFGPSINSEYGSMFHFVSLIYPTAREQEIFIDRFRLDAFSLRVPITVPSVNTPMSAVIAQVGTGDHKITSPVPVFAVAHGVGAWDGYSAVIMGRGDRQPIDTPQFDLGAILNDPRSCEEFTGMIRLEDGIDATEGVYRMRLTVTYDPAFVRLVSAAPTGVFAGLNVTLDTSTPGTIIVHLSSERTPIVGTGDILALTFYGRKAGTTSLRSSISASQLDFVHLEVAKYEHVETFDIRQSRYSGTSRITVINATTVLGSLEPFLTHVILEDPIKGFYSEVRVRISYDHDLLEIPEEGGVVQANTKMIDWAWTRRQIDFETDEFIFRPVTSSFIEGTGALIRFRFFTYVTRHDTTTVRVTASLTSADDCPTDITGTLGTDLFEGIDSCQSPLIRTVLRSLPFEFLEITPNPSSGTLDAHIRHVLPTGAEVTCILTDLTGKRIWTTSAVLATAPEAHIQLTLPTWVNSGTYLLSIEAAGYMSSRQIVLQR